MSPRKVMNQFHAGWKLAVQCVLVYAHILCCTVEKNRVGGRVALCLLLLKPWSSDHGSTAPAPSRGISKERARSRIEPKPRKGYRVPKKPPRRWIPLLWKSAMQTESKVCSTCSLCKLGLVTFKYCLHTLVDKKDFWPLVPCSHPFAEDVRERLTMCHHWSETEKEQFQFHAQAALDAELRMDWTDAADHYHRSLAIAEEVKDGLGCRASHLWLQMWAAFALISLYHLKLKEYDKYFHLSFRVSILLEAHVQDSLSYLTASSKKPCYQQFLRVEAMLLNTEAELQADRNRVNFERGFLNLVSGQVCTQRHESYVEKHGNHVLKTKLAISEVELCGQLCCQHGHAGNYTEYFHWRMELKRLAAEDWWRYTPNFNHSFVHLETGIENKGLDAFELPRLISYLISYITNTRSTAECYLDSSLTYYIDELDLHGPHVSHSCFIYCDDSGMDGDHLHTTYDIGVEDFDLGKGELGLGVMKYVLQLVKQNWHGGSDRSKLSMMQVCQTQIIKWFDSFSHEEYDTWLDPAQQQERRCEEARRITAFNEHFVTAWALGLRSSSIVLRSHQWRMGRIHVRRANIIFSSILILMHTEESGNPDMGTHNPRDSYVHTEVHGLWHNAFGVGSVFSDYADAWLLGMQHYRTAALIAGLTTFELRDAYQKLDKTLGSAKLGDRFAEACFQLQDMIVQYQHIQKMLLTCCREFVPESNQGPSVRKFLEYGMPGVADGSNSTPGSASRPQSSNLTLQQEAFVWGERMLHCSLLYQLPTNRLSFQSQLELRRFHQDDGVAWDVLKSARAACGAGAVVVEYHFLGPTRIGIYVLRKREGVVLRTYETKTTRDQSFESRDLFHGVGDEAWDICQELDKGSIIDMDDTEGVVPKSLIHLHTLLYDPIADLLQDMPEDEKLVIIPGLGFMKVPFPLLYNPRSKQFLFERHVISLSPSLQVIKHLASSFAAIQSCSLVNDHIVGATITDHKLQSGAAELKSLVDVFGEKNVTKVNKDEVTVTEVLDQVRIPSKRGCCQAFLHITTHGGADSQYPRGVLHVGKDNSGALRSEEIVSSGVDLRTFVVVLAACQSAKGKESFEGLLNLPRAFMIAGVPSVVASQYLVDDDINPESNSAATPHLMAMFYTNLSQGEDVATALCHAMRHMKSQPGSAWELYQYGVFVVWGLPSCKMPPHIRKSLLRGRGYHTYEERRRQAARKLGFSRSLAEGEVAGSK